MKTLPYFRWYPADAETDTDYAAMTDAELGFYHRCLNRAWLNDGLPADLDELARTMKISRSHLDRLWNRVGRRFFEEDGKLRNKRQEEERSAATTKSERNTNAVRTRYERRTNEVQHARARAESVSVSDSSVSLGKESLRENPSVREIPKRELSSAGPDGGFPNWWRMWSAVRGSNHRMQAEHAYQTWVETSMEAACLECTQSYLQSLDNPAKGYNPENFLMDQSREQFGARWPARSPPKPKRKSLDDIAMDVAAEMEAEEREAEERKRARGYDGGIHR